MSRLLLDIEGAGDGRNWRLLITEGLCVGPKGNAFMFGGVGLAAAIMAAEQATERDAVWASAQFLSYARVRDALDLSVEVLNAGRSVTQVRVLAADRGKPILTANAALGSREGLPEGQWAKPPEIPPPDHCIPISPWPIQDDDAQLMDRLEVRAAPGRDGAGPPGQGNGADGRQAMWMRVRDDQPVDVARLAMFADFVPSGLAAAFGRPGGGNSLDNTLRVCRIVRTNWVLCDMQVSAAARGFGHGAIHMYAEDGTLMASGSQSVILRFAETPTHRS